MPPPAPRLGSTRSLSSRGQWVLPEGQGLGRGEPLEHPPSRAEPSPITSGQSSELASPSLLHVAVLTPSSRCSGHPSPSPSAGSGLPRQQVISNALALGDRGW